MSTTEISTGTEPTYQKEDMLSPSEEKTPSVINGTLPPLNFSALTPRQFGICVQSFTPASASAHKDKSRLAQLKARRRSSVGVRGSPETNSLIRFVAQQRMKTPTNQLTPEHGRSCPFLPRVASTLRQKMASFQSLMDVEESEVCDRMPRQDSNTGGVIKTRDYLSDGNSKENHSPVKIPTTKRRRCLGPLKSCEVEIREANAPVLQISLKEHREVGQPLMQVLKRAPSPPSDTVKDALAVLISPPLHADFELQACSPTTNQQVGVVDPPSPNRSLPDNPASPADSIAHFSIPPLSCLLAMKPTGENDSTGTSAVQKKKRVHFGGRLSPEFFDKNLPPSTPLQKGGTPARAPTPGRALRLRSLLKTPQRSESQTPQPQRDPSSPTMFGASPTLAIPRTFTMQSVGEDTEEKDGKIVFPSMEEIDTEVSMAAGYTWDSQPLNLNSAFNEEFLSQTVTESESEENRTPKMAVLDEPASSPEKERQPEAAPVRSSNRRKKVDQECESTSEAPARSGSRKRKHPEESEPVKRSARSAAKLASGKMKNPPVATRRWNRDVDRSLYGSREYASKNPALSPITERLSFIGRSQAAPPTSSASRTEHAAPKPETHLNPEIADSIQATGELTSTHALEKASEDFVTSPDSIKESTTVKDKRLTGQRSRGRWMRKRKVGVADCEEPLDKTGGQTKEHCEDQTTTNPETSRVVPLCTTGPEQREIDIKLNDETSAYLLSTNLDGNSECPVSLTTSQPSCKHLEDLGVPAELTKQKNKQGSRSSASSSVLQEQGDHEKQNQMSHEVEEKAREDQSASQRENNCRSSSDCREEEVPSLDLAPWQADFNFEDVFKPVDTRGQRSVRRSLRNQGKVVHSNNNGAGLAWIPCTSPDSCKETRRKTRGRRLSAALPVQSSASEDVQDHTS